MRLDVRVAVAALASLAGCDTSSRGVPSTRTGTPRHTTVTRPPADSAPRPSYLQTLPDGPCAVENVTGTVSGVTLAIRSDACVYKRGSSATFRYEVTATANTPPIKVPARTACECSDRTADPASLLHWSIHGTSPAGDEKRYCICDVGCCPPGPAQKIQLDARESSGTIEWPGREWNGPSDTGNPLGDVFPPGRYEVSVIFEGYDAGTVEAKLPIEIID